MTNVIDTVHICKPRIEIKSSLLLFMSTLVSCFNM